MRLRCAGARVLLADTKGPILAASDHVRAVAESLRRAVPAGRRFTTRGTDGFGRSDSRAALRRFFGVDRYSMAVKAMAMLAVDRMIPDGQVEASRRLRSR